MKILIVAPHMDDEVLGCAGAICKHKEAGDKIWVIIAAHRIYRHHYDEKLDSLQKKHVLDTKRILKYDKEIFLNLPDERLDVGIQDIIIALEKHVNAIKPEIVYVPFRGDNNQDHRAVFDALRVVLRPSISMKTDILNI